MAGGFSGGVVDFYSLDYYYCVFSISIDSGKTFLV